MINNSMTIEHKSGRTNISDHKMATVKEVIKFIYTGRVDKIDVENAEDLLEAADKFLLEGMKKICELYLVSKVTVANSIEMLVLGNKYVAAGLKKRAMETIEKEG